VYVNATLLPVAMAAAQRGGEVLRRYFRAIDPADVEEKAKNDFVSAADHASEDAIAEYLNERTPGLGLLAEERGASGLADARWVVDPLDGTANFVHGFPHFAVSVAFVAGGRVEVGAIYDPIHDELFAAARGRGASCNGRPLRVSNRPGLAGAFLTTGFPFRVHRHLDTYLRVFRELLLRVAAIRRPGAAALDLAHTAAGVFDGFFEFCLAPWDIAAGSLLVREAGGMVGNLDGGDDILTRGNVVAAAPGVQHELLTVIGRHCRDGEIVA
jgi:myo-inositol-1(or 4)-monophosphatase